MDVSRMKLGGAFVLAAVLLVLLDAPSATEGLLKRCVMCRSRGELGSCKDPFTLNYTQIENEHGVAAPPCASGWCAKIIERRNLNNEYGTATERLCLQRAPDDNEERCAYTKWKYKDVFMCMCNGDMCNAGTRLPITTILYPLTIVITLTQWL